MSGARKVILALVVLAVLAVALLWATTPRSFGEETPSDRIVHWTGGGSFSPDAEVTSLGSDRVVLLGARARKNRITAWKFHHHFKVTSGSVKKSATAQGCGTATSDSVGENGVGWTVVEAHVSIHWCWEGGGYDGTKADIVGKIHVNTWGDTAGWSLWSYDGVDSMVRGSGTACAASLPVCWEYAYRRPYFKFSRGLTNGLSQHEVTWAAITVRGIGSWEVDHLTA